MKFRTGFGYDVHQLVENKDFYLGGIKINHHKGAIGHSDADVLIHTICDALLGAANLRDIGFHFPPGDEQYKGIDSKILLSKVIKLLAEHNYSIGNIDATVVLQTPKINPYIPEMTKLLTELMGIDVNDLSIKATTSEWLGFEGREEGVSAFATVLIYQP